MGRGAYPGGRADLGVCSGFVTHLSRRIYVRCTAVTEAGVAWSHVLRTRTSVGRVDGSGAARCACVRCARDGGAGGRRTLVRVVPRAFNVVLDARRVCVAGP